MEYLSLALYCCHAVLQWHRSGRKSSIQNLLRYRSVSIVCVIYMRCAYSPLSGPVVDMTREIPFEMLNTLQV